MSPHVGLSFGALLKRYRRAARLTQEELAEKAGYNVNYIGMLERGARGAPAATVGLLADVLELETEEREVFHQAAIAGTPSHSPSVFGDLLRRYRLAAGLSQEQLAERAHLSQRTISDLEVGPAGTPRGDTIDLLIEALELSGEDRAVLLAAAPMRQEESRSGVRSRFTLPAELTPLVGREHDEARAVQVLRSGIARLLTLTGPGGVGKTRLALRVAASLEDGFGDGVVFVPLAPVRDSALVPSAIAGALELREMSGGPVIQTIKTYLQDRELLLVLDNFEHVLDAAPLVSDLLVSCPGLKIMATSRAALRLRGEQEMDVLPLALPDAAESPSPDWPAHYPAIALFLQRAQARGSDLRSSDTALAAIAEICRRLDGLPLAIELAAARIKVLTPAALLARLGHGLHLLTEGARDLPERQRTMHGTITWSYQLLQPDEQQLLRRLSPFAGGCTLEAIAVVAGEEAEGDLLRNVEALVEQSLLRRIEGAATESRYLMLETIREFAAEQLAASDERDEVAERHAHYFRALAESAEPHLFGPEQQAWLARLDREHDNIRAALRWTVASGKPELGLRIAVSFWRFWQARGYLTEGRRWLEELLPLYGSDHATPAAANLRAEALYVAAVLAYDQSDYQRSMALYEKALELFRTLDAPKGLAATLNGMGLVALGLGEVARAGALLGDALAVRREVGDLWGIAAALANLGNVARSMSDFRLAAERYRESAALFHELGDSSKEAIVLCNLGEVSRSQGDYHTAQEALKRAREIFTRLQEPWGAALAVANLAAVVRDLGDLERSEALDEEGLQLRRGLGSPRDVGLSLSGLAETALYRGAYERARELGSEALDLLRDVEDPLEIAGVTKLLGHVAREAGFPEEAGSLYMRALANYRETGYMLGAVETLEGLAHLAADEDQTEWAARLFASAASHRDRMGTPVSPVRAHMLHARLGELRRALGPHRFDQEWQNGESLHVFRALEAPTEDEAPPDSC